MFMKVMFRNHMGEYKSCTSLFHKKVDITTFVIRFDIPSKILYSRCVSGAIQNPRHVKPQTRQTSDTSNLRQIKPQIMNIGLPTTKQIRIPFIFQLKSYLKT